MRESAMDLSAGLVLHLDPDTLEREGGAYTCSSEMRVRNGHFFVLLRRDSMTGEWSLVPVYSNDSGGRRVPIDHERAGHPKWTDARAFADPKQIWTATPEAIVRAAAAGGDQSRPEARNRLNDPGLQCLLARLLIKPYGSGE